MLVSSSLVLNVNVTLGFLSWNRSTPVPQLGTLPAGKPMFPGKKTKHPDMSFRVKQTIFKETVSLGSVWSLGSSGGDVVVGVAARSLKA